MPKSIVPLAFGLNALTLVREALPTTLKVELLVILLVEFVIPFIIIKFVNDEFPTRLKYELFINQNDGIYLTYNPGEKFGDDRTGSTPKLQKFSFWKKYFISFNSFC